MNKNKTKKDNRTEEQMAEDIRRAWQGVLDSEAELKKVTAELRKMLCDEIQNMGYEWLLEVATFIGNDETKGGAK